MSGKRGERAYKDVPLEKTGGLRAKLAINTESKLNRDPRIDLEASLGGRWLLFTKTVLVCGAS